MLVTEMSKLEDHIELSRDEDEDPVSSEFDTSKLLFSSSDNDMSHKVFSSGLLGFVGVEVVSLFPCNSHPGHIQFVLALFGQHLYPMHKR